MIPAMNCMKGNPKLPSNRVVRSTGLERISNHGRAAECGRLTSKTQACTETFGICVRSRVARIPKVLRAAP